MVRRLVVTFACSYLAACGGEAQQLPAHVIDVDGLARTYHLFVPASPPKSPMPLLVGAHGAGGRGEAFPQQSAFEELAEREGVLVALPQSEKLPLNEGGWQLNTDAQSRHDIDFVEALIDDIAARHSVDAARVYATGYSLGSMFTYELACHASSRFAAIASHAGTMPVSPKSCAPQHNVSIMHIHGARDFLIDYDETWSWKAWESVGAMMDIPGLIKFWSDRHGCQEKRENESASSLHIVHDRCEQGARVEHHRLDDAGHGWPETIDGVSTHQVIWTFLSGFSKR